MGVFRPGFVVEGRYRVLRCIEAGGMGAVYEVLDERTQHRRALKVMLPLLVDDPTLRARFALEARITGDIESDHIVNVLDAGVEPEENLPFIVMERLRGESLGSLLRSNGGPLAAADVVLYLWQIALALEKTHAAGIVHRDLKPENLFLTYRDDGSPCIKILDFGIAKLVSHTLPDVHTRPMLGTAFYMSPEQARNDRHIDARADVYSLGHIAYTLLVGEPYWHETFVERGSPFLLLKAVVEGAREPPSKRAARRKGIHLPAAFDAWFACATAPSADDRYTKAIAAATALADFMGVVLRVPSNHGKDCAPSSRAPYSATPSGADLQFAATDQANMTLARKGHVTDTAFATTRASGGARRTPKPRSITRGLTFAIVVSTVALTVQDTKKPVGLEHPAAAASAISAPQAPSASPASVDWNACMLSQFPPHSFDSDKPLDETAVCSQTDPRKGAAALRSHVVLARTGSGPTEAMREWAQLSWYEMAAFAVIRARCCESPLPLELPPPIGSCEPLDKTLDALGAAADTGDVETAVVRMRKALMCMVTSGGEGDYSYKGRPPDGSESVLRKTLERPASKSR